MVVYEVYFESLASLALSGDLPVLLQRAERILSKLNIPKAGSGWASRTLNKRREANPDGRSEVAVATPGGNSSRRIEKVSQECHGMALDDCAQSQLLQADAPTDAKVEEVSLLTETPLSQQSRPVHPDSQAAPSRPPAQERSRLSQAPLQNTERLAACTENVSEEELLELSALTRPPPVRGIVESALMLLGFRDASWAAARAAFEDPGSFKENEIYVSGLAASKGLEQSRNRCGSLEEWCCKGRSAVSDILGSRYGEAALAEAAASKRLAASTSGANGTNGTNGMTPDLEAKVPRPALGDLVVTPDIYSMTPNELRHVRDLKVHRPKVGEVTFHGEIDLVSNPDILEDPMLVRLLST
eukprot:Skav221782  [mRNA]  locus=scaffold4067:8274:23904:- [translate_table: standard]